MTMEIDPSIDTQNSAPQITNDGNSPNFGDTLSTATTRLDPNSPFSSTKSKVNKLKNSVKNPSILHPEEVRRDLKVKNRRWGLDDDNSSEEDEIPLTILTDNRTSTKKRAATKTDDRKNHKQYTGAIPPPPPLKYFMESTE